MKKYFNFKNPIHVLIFMGKENKLLSLKDLLKRNSSQYFSYTAIICYTDLQLQKSFPNHW